jgi:hypothetical protein
MGRERGEEREGRGKGILFDKQQQEAMESTITLQCFDGR